MNQKTKSQILNTPVFIVSSEPNCKTCYIGQTGRDISVRIK